MAFPLEVADEAMVACKRFCAICEKQCGTNIELHHIVPSAKGGEDVFSNCIPLCFECHAEVEHYNSCHPKGRKFTKSELTKRRDDFYTKIQNGILPNTSKTSVYSNGNNNIVANSVNITTERVVKRVQVVTDPGGKHITTATAAKIKTLHTEIVDMLISAGKDPKREASQLWVKFKKAFSVTSYKEVPLEKSDEAIQWFYKQKNMLLPKARKTSPDLWKNAHYKSIYAKWRELGYSKEELYSLAYEYLNLKTSILSLKELTQTNLHKLKSKVYSMSRKT